MSNFRRLTAADVECRVAQAGFSGKDKKQAYCTLLIYKDARVDRAILNETVGSFNWSTEYMTIDDKLFCKLSIKDPQTGAWVSKMEVGTESYTEKEKGQVSDALKRAGFAWGIGEELYSAPKIWINLNEGEYSIKDDKVQPKGNFYVTQMQVHPKTRKMTYISIADRNGTERFRWGKFKTAISAEQLEAAAKRAAENHTEKQAERWLYDTYDVDENTIDEFRTLCMNNQLVTL